MGRRVRDAVRALGRGSVVSFGFVLRQLALTGHGLPSAQLSFTRGLNVIAGPSDTGKTFIAQCIDFAMGSGDVPKEIPEAAHYTSVLLEIESQNADRVFVLERSLRGGDVRLSTPGEADRILAAKHQADKEDSVSRFLLELSGLDSTRVRTNQQGNTRPLSFRDIASLIIVDEESVISATSPILSGQYITRTAESSVFRLLLTGTDDSSVIAKEDPKIAKGRQEGKAEVLEVLLKQNRDQLTELKILGGVTEVREQLTRLDAVFEAASAELAIEQSSAASLEERRRNAWTRLRQVESRADVLSELQKRFELLQEQYSSDLRRLEAITEAGIRLGQMKEERCPVCGALSEHHASEHQQGRAAPADVAQACKAEAAKTEKLLQDLRTTLASNAAAVERLGIERSARQTELEVTGTELKTLLEPRLQAAVQKVRESQATRDACRRSLELLERMQNLERLLAEANAPRKKERAEGLSSVVSAGEAEQFSKDVEALLRSWHFPNLDRVTFSEDDQDIVISSRPRGSHGKGVRAITHAAFNLALLRLCAREGRPFPGLVLIDSPLVVYREPDNDEGAFPHDVKDAFYRSLASDFPTCQVIILENDKPPPELAVSANCIVFTGTGLGRRGFIPAAQSFSPD